MAGRAPERRSDETRYYEILGVPKTATPLELRRAWHRGAMNLHPDKGGDEEQFKELSEAYYVLGDAERREIYDQHGEGAFKKGIVPGSGPRDSFAEIDACSGRGGKLTLGEDARHNLEVSREELESGTTKSFRVARNVLCPKCKGKGSKSGAAMTCAPCRGTGTRIPIPQLGSGLFWGMEQSCGQCKGTGEFISEKDRCPHCGGAKIVAQTKFLQVVVAKGMKHGDTIHCPGEAHEAPNTIPGDIVFTLRHHAPKVKTKESNSANRRRKFL